MKFTEIELKKIQDLYKKNTNKFHTTIAGAIAFGIVFLFIPAELLGFKAQRAGVSGNILESLGVAEGLIFVSIIILIIILSANSALLITKLKKDIREQEKVITKIKVEKIEHLSEKDIKEAREFGIDATDNVYFERNDYKIKYYPFNRINDPELLETKEMILEIAKHSKIEFKREIIK